MAPQDPADDPELLGKRKVDHLTLCRDEDVESRATRTLLDQVRLLHDSLPELDLDAIDLRTTLAGLPLRAPLMISGMTGGAAMARDVNRTLAQVAEEFGFAFGVGSQRAMLRDPALTDTYRVRDVAPSVALLGNIGAVQAAQCSLAELQDLVAAIGANALCIHLNPAQEVVQGHGDRDFRGCLDRIELAVAELGVPVVVKETGCGMSPSTLRRLRRAGVQTVDVSGAGGTTWVGVETLRAEAHLRTVGETLWDWGVPTAPSIVYARREGMEVIASGGIRDGLDAARALALGASVASSALPWLRAAMNGGLDAARKLASTNVAVLRATMLLTGSPDVAALRRAPRVLGAELRGWLDGVEESP